MAQNKTTTATTTKYIYKCQWHSHTSFEYVLRHSHIATTTTLLKVIGTGHKPKSQTGAKKLDLRQRKPCLSMNTKRKKHKRREMLTLVRLQILLVDIAESIVEIV